VKVKVRYEKNANNKLYPVQRYHRVNTPRLVSRRAFAKPPCGDLGDLRGWAGREGEPGIRVAG
jgi:hypothetical protein